MKKIIWDHSGFFFWASSWSLFASSCSFQIPYSLSVPNVFLSWYFFLSFLSLSFSKSYIILPRLPLVNCINNNRNSTYLLCMGFFLTYLLSLYTHSTREIFLKSQKCWLFDCFDPQLSTLGIQALRLIKQSEGTID